MSNEYLNNKVFEAIITRFQTSKRDKAKQGFILEDMRGAFERKTKREANVLTDEQKLGDRTAIHEAAVIEFQDSQRHLAVAFYTLSENIVRYAKFNMIDPDDAIQEGVMICFEKIDRFDSRKGKAFNYMTTCILNHYRQLYRTARNYTELKRKYQEYQENTQKK